MDTESLIRQTYADFAAGNMVAVFDRIAEDAVYQQVATEGIAPYAGRTGGKAAFMARIARIAADWRVDRFDVAEVIAAGNRAAARVFIRFVNHANGVAVETQFAHFWTIDDDRVTELVEFHDTGLAARAMGM